MPHWNAIALRLREHCEVAAHGCFNRGPAFKGDNYVSKALVGTILDAFWPKCGAESKGGGAQCDFDVR